MIKINYYQMGCQQLEKVAEATTKPRLLLHVCCAPCTTYPLALLTTFFDVTLYYENSNIFPLGEYQMRLDELTSYVQNKHPNVALVVPAYENKLFMQKLALRKNDQEGGPRCRFCFYLRLDASYQYASEQGFDYFTTALTISRKKDAQAINRIGLILQKRYPHTLFLPHDFKKNKGQEKAVTMSKENELYRQTYCGCAYSIPQIINKKTT